MSDNDIRERIWNNWVNKTGNCSNCDAHDYRYRPGFGGGDIDSHVMIVLSDPNDDRNSCERILEQPKRKNRSFNYGYSADNGWSMMDMYLNPITERIDGCDNADDIYFTNAHKCPKQSGKRSGFTEKDKAAVEECGRYLEGEIDAVDPTVVVALSRQAIKAIGRCSSVDFDGSLTPTKYVENWMNGSRFYGNNPAVVGGIHPSPEKLHLNLKSGWYGDENVRSWYFDEVAKCVNSALSTK